MAEYIEREALYQFLTEQLDEETGMYSKGRNVGVNIARSALHNKEIAPTVDVVPVVRCKDCKYWHNGGFWSGSDPAHLQYAGYCPVMQFVRHENDFCSEGRRKDENTDFEN